MKNCEDIINSMCYTWRHDYGLRISDEDGEKWPVISGMTDSEAKSLYNSMKQIYENCIEPYMDFKE